MNKPSTKHRKETLNAYANSDWALSHKDHIGGCHIEVAIRLIKRAADSALINNVVELGAMYGALIRNYIRPMFPKAKVIGVDLMELAIDYAQERGGAHYITADLNYELPIQSGWADLLVSTETLEHLHDLDTCLGEVQRILRPGGWFVSTTPIGHNHDGGDHHVFLSADEWAEKIDEFLSVQHFERMNEAFVPGEPTEVAILACRRGT